MSQLMFSRKKNKNNKSEATSDNTKRPPSLDIRTVSKARSWVGKLPVTDMGETTRRLFSALTKLNQEPITPQVRIEVTEVLLPYIRMVLDNLDRHFLSRSFPLPERSQKIFDLKNALIMETAGSYQLAALEMLTKKSVTKKLVLLSIDRAVKFMSQVLMNGYEIYATHPKSIWHDIHHLYLLACENGLEKKVTSSKAGSTADDLSIEATYKLINLVALSAPNTLRQGEVIKVRDFFKQCVNSIAIINDPQKVESKYAHVALLNSDESATLMPVSDLVSSPTSRIFDLSEVIYKLDQFVSLSEENDLGKHKTWTMLTHSLAKRMVYVLTTIRNRRYKRFEREDKATIGIRMNDVIELIRENDVDSFSEQINQDIEDDNIYEALAEGDQVSSPWSDVDIDALAEERDVKLQTWHIENSSSGGYGLKQITSDSSTARVGELTVIKDPKDEAGLWQISVIRWMDSYKKIGLRLGLEILSLHSMVVKVDKVTNRELTQTLPVEGILLPTIDGARDEANLIFPGFIFHANDELSLTLGSRQQKVRILSVDDTVGSFAYCRFENFEDDAISEGSLESFDDVWEFL